MRDRFFRDSGLGLFWWLALAALSVASVVPLLRAEHLPLQDLPQHLAAIRVLRDHPDLALGHYFELDLARTQYLAYYGAAWLLSYVFGIALANKLLIAAALVSLPWSLASLLRALGRDPRLSVFAFGLVYNAHLVLGFLNFIAALPLLFWGLGCALKTRDAPTRRRQVELALWLVLCFYTHVVPFAFLALGAALVLWGGGVAASMRRSLVFAPAALAALFWLHDTPAGHATLSAAGGKHSDKEPQFASVLTATRELPMWLTDVLQGTRDEQLLVAWAALLFTVFALGMRVTQRDALEVARARAHPLAYRLSLLCPLAFVAYFVAPTSYDWIWPISARFPLLALLFALLLAPRVRGFSGSAVLAAAGFVALLGFREVGQAFAAFEREEVGDIEAAIAHIPEGERVSGLIFDRGSQYVKFSPFLHYVSLYQAARGGAVLFTFADFPQSPFRYRDAARPPRVPPRWEWLPDRVDPQRDLGWYRYVLVRGGPGRIERQPQAYDNVFRGSRWTVWRRK